LDALKWKIQMLGGLALYRGGQSVSTFPTEKSRLLLAYLAAYPSLTSTREELVERFWPDSDPNAGRVSLRQALALLRRILEPGDVPPGTFLVADRVKVCLNTEFLSTDLAEWDRARALANRTVGPNRLCRLEEAARGYGGEFVPGAYMDWVLQERQHRQEQYVGLLVQLTDAYLEDDHYSAARESAQLVLKADPFHEEVHERLIRAFALEGNVVSARRHYDKLCKLLRDELNLDPNPKLQALYAGLDRLSLSRVETQILSASSILPPTGLTPLSLPAPATEALRLPLRLTRFFGRTEELGLLQRWLNDPALRLITLTGMGGVGKTRLAIEAVQLSNRFGGSITYVPLSDTPHPELLLPTILKNLGLPAVAPTDPILRIRAALDVPSHLLVLDNFEQIAESAAEILWQLLEQIPTLACLITSRQPLNLAGEQELALAPLPVPDARWTAEELSGNPTVQMLVDRMRASRPDFQITSANAASVAALCTRLEGIPLAVELASGWARDLTIGQMQERMSRRFNLLVSRQRGVPPRHQSLRATVESSFQLLSPPLQRLFLRLSVFRGGWCAEAAQQIGQEEAAEPSAIPEQDDLCILREQSLITVHEVEDHVRYGMLETLRAFGQEMLDAAETRRVERSHALWFLEFALSTAEKLHGREQAHWLDRLDEEQDNFRAAMEYAEAHDPPLGLRLANALYWFWYVRSGYREGEQWLLRMLERATQAPKSDIAWGLLAAGHLANCQSNNEAAVQRYTAAQAIFEEIGEEAGVAHCLTRRGNAAQEMLDVDLAYRLSSEALTRFRTVDSPSGLLLALFYHLNILLDTASVREGPAHFAEALAIAENLGDLRFLSLLEFCFGSFRHKVGDLSGALEGYRNALTTQALLREPVSISFILRDLTVLLTMQGETTSGRNRMAAKVWGARLGLRRRIGNPIGLHEQQQTQEMEQTLQARLADADYRLAIESGQNLDVEACLSLAAEAIDLLE